MLVFFLLIEVHHLLSIWFYAYDLIEFIINLCNVLLFCLHMHEALMTVVHSRHILHFNNYNFFAFLQNTLYLTLGYDDINRHTYQCELILSTYHTCTDWDFVYGGQSCLYHNIACHWSSATGCHCKTLKMRDTFVLVELNSKDSIFGPFSFE